MQFKNSATLDEEVVHMDFLKIKQEDMNDINNFLNNQVMNSIEINNLFFIF